eukprot:2078380-Rhodomonas_salina.7
MSKTERSNAEMAISEKEEGKRRAECARDRGEEASLTYVVIQGWNAGLGCTWAVSGPCICRSKPTVLFQCQLDRSVGPRPARTAHASVFPKSRSGNLPFSSDLMHSQYVDGTHFLPTNAKSSSVRRCSDWFALPR